MPGDYGPGGKWIHDRAHRIMEEGKTQEQYGDKRGKSIAYALATQQAHKTGKSPKDFRTAKGVRVAKRKYDAPKGEYQKTAARQRVTDYANLALAAIRRGMSHAKAFKLLDAGKIDELRKFAPGEVALQAFEKAMPKAAAAPLQKEAVDLGTLSSASNKALEDFWTWHQRGEAARAAGYSQEQLQPVVDMMRKRLRQAQLFSGAHADKTMRLIESVKNAPAPTPAPSGGGNLGRNLALVAGGALGTGLLLHTLAKHRAQRAAAAQSEMGPVKMAMLNGLFDELEKISQAPGSLAHRAQLGAPGAWGSLQTQAPPAGGGGGTPGGSSDAPAPAPPPPPPTTAPAPPAGADIPSAMSASDLPGGGPPGGGGAMKAPGGMKGSDIPGGLGASDIPGGGDPMGGGPKTAPPPPPPPTPPAPSPGGGAPAPGQSAAGPATAAGRMQASQAGQAQAAEAIKGGFQPGAAKPMTASDLGI